MARDFSLPSSYADSLSAPSAPILGRIGAYLGSLFQAQPAKSEVERYIMANGGVLTDHLEREISRRFGRIVE